MVDVPRQVPKNLRKFIKKIPARCEVRQSKSHYFLYIMGERVCCVGGNASNAHKRNEYESARKVRDIQKYLNERLGIQVDE